MDLSIREVATLTGTSERAVRAGLARGSRRGFKRAGQWRVPREAPQDDPAERRRAVAKADHIRAALEPERPKSHHHGSGCKTTA